MWRIKPRCRLDVTMNESGSSPIIKEGLMSQIFKNQKNKYEDYKFAQIFGQVGTPDFDFQKLFYSLDCHRDFYGVGVVYNDGSHSFLVRAPLSTTRLAGNKVTHVIVTKISNFSHDIAKKNLKNAVISTSKEITSTILSCGACIIFAAGTILSDGATILSIGATTPLAIISTMGTVATAAQCANGVLRLIDIYGNEGKRVRRFDSQDWYIATLTALDFISLAGASRDLYIAVKAYRAIKSASAFASVSMLKWLRGFAVTEKERISLSRGIIRHFNPSASEKQISIWLTSNKYPRMIDSERVIAELNNQLNNAVMASMAYAGSAIGGTIRNPGSIRQTSAYALGILRTVEII